MCRKLTRNRYVLRKDFEKNPSILLSKYSNIRENVYGRHRLIQVVRCYSLTSCFRWIGSNVPLHDQQWTPTRKLEIPYVGQPSEQRKCRAAVSDLVSDSGLLTMCTVVVQICCVGFSQWQWSTYDVHSGCTGLLCRIRSVTVVYLRCAQWLLRLSFEQNRLISTIRNTSSNWLKCCVLSV